jgi:hypothetical protein
MSVDRVKLPSGPTQRLPRTSQRSVGALHQPDLVPVPRSAVRVEDQLFSEGALSHVEVDRYERDPGRAADAWTTEPRRFRGGQPHTARRHDRQIVAERQGERIMVLGKQQGDQDQEGDFADTARDAGLPPRIACEGMQELSLSRVRRLVKSQYQASLTRALAELRGARGASNRRVPTVSVGVTAEGCNLILAHGTTDGDIWSIRWSPEHPPAVFCDDLYDTFARRRSAPNGGYGCGPLL